MRKSVNETQTRRAFSLKHYPRGVDTFGGFCYHRGMKEKPTVSVSLCPTFWCNGRCPHCYLGSAVTRKGVITPSRLRDTLFTIAEHRKLNGNVNLYGGEVTIIPRDTLAQYFDIINGAVQKSRPLEVHTSINVSSNFTLNLDTLRWMLGLKKEYDVLVGVSLNFERKLADGRLMDRVVAENLKTFDDATRRRITAKVVVTPSVYDPTDVFEKIEDLGLGGLHFLQYSDASKATEHYSMTNKDYERFMIRAYKEYDERDYSFELFNPWVQFLGNLTQSHVFVNPQGKFGLLDYDSLGVETFRWFKNFEDWESEAQRLDSQLLDDNHCLTCQYFGQCVGEHLKYSMLTDSCSGLPLLTRFLKCKV